MGTHSDPFFRLTFAQWLRYRRLYRSMVVDAARKREVLTAGYRRQLKAEARRAAREVAR